MHLLSAVNGEGVARQQLDLWALWALLNRRDAYGEALVHTTIRGIGSGGDAHMRTQLLAWLLANGAEIATEIATEMASELGTGPPPAVQPPPTLPAPRPLAEIGPGVQRRSAGETRGAEKAAAAVEPPAVTQPVAVEKRGAADPKGGAADSKGGAADAADPFYLLLYLALEARQPQADRAAAALLGVLALLCVLVLLAP